MPYLAFDQLCYGYPFGGAIAVQQPVNEVVSKVDAPETMFLVN